MEMVVARFRDSDYIYKSCSFKGIVLDVPTTNCMDFQSKIIS